MWRLVAAVVIVCFGCASTATIARTDAPDNEARIEQSDAGALYVRGRNGRIYRIPREGISAIDHPGNVEILIGGILAGLGALVLVSANMNARASDKDELMATSLIYFVPGLALLTSGLLKYVPSVRAADAFESAEIAPPAPWIPPPAPAGAPPQPPTPPAMPPPAAPPAPPEAPAPPPTEPEVVPGAT